MGVYSVGVTKSGVNTANTVMWQIKTGAGSRIRVREIGIFVAVAPTTAPTFVVVRPSTTGTSSATSTPQPHDANEAAATATLETAWSAAPTFSTSGPFLRAAGLPVTAGAGVIFTFPDPIIVGTSAGLQICNLVATGATTGTFGFYATWDE